MSKRDQGFTLVELMVTLAVAIILIAVGMPLFSGVAANNRATAQANTYLGAFKLARSEAVKRATEVSVCAVADPTANPVVCGANTDWVNGLLVFTDGGTAGSVDGGMCVSAYSRTRSPARSPRRPVPSCVSRRRVRSGMRQRMGPARAVPPAYNSARAARPAPKRVACT